MIVGVVGVALTLLLWRAQIDSNQQNLEDRFDLAAQDRSEAIERELRADLTTVAMVGGLRDADAVDAAVFAAVSRAALDSNEGSIQALEWIPRITDTEREPFEARTQRIHSGFVIRERNADGVLVSADDRAEYFPVTLVEPLQGNEAAVGFDLASNPARLEALERARDTGGLLVTQRIRLVQETAEQFGFLAFQPVYREGAAIDTVEQRRASLLGFTLGVYRAGDILTAALSVFDAGGIEILLVDESAPGGEKLLASYSSAVPPIPELAPTGGSSEGANRLERLQTFEIGGRDWSVIAIATPAFGSASSAGTWTTLVSGLVVTIVLVALFHVTLHRADRIQQVVEQRTAQLTALNDELEARAGELTRSNALLVTAVANLERSNHELEEFAYVASHDLQEPLRMVTSYTQLLSRRYHEQLDSDADEFINFAVSGTARMQMLIHDLLEYSRVGRNEEEFGSCDCSAIVDQVLSDVALSLEELGARVTRDELPVVHASAPRIYQLFSNLIGNGLKYHGAEPPRVHISATRIDIPGAVGQDSTRAGWNITVRDEGIGFDVEHGERIFRVFQRLHTREEYEGNGIGLAICKKIVEGHGGEISARSEPGNGAAFSCTLPAAIEEEDSGERAA